MSEVLNPYLYSSMLRCLDGVRVVDRGKELSGYYEPDHLRKCTKLKILSRGETYLANCPFCGDSRGRLAVNHRYGLNDERTGYRGTELWKCYNEECQGKKENRYNLKTKLLDSLQLGRFKIRLPDVKIASPGSLEPCEFPGLFVTLTDLPETHPAIIYLRDRGYEPGELAEDWGVGYALSVPARSRGSMAQDRIIIPVNLDGVMVGWQARYVGEIDWKGAGIPKYLTYFRKSMTLYGINEINNSDHVAVVEGVTDVWRYGYGAVCPFGKKLSHDQAAMLCKRAASRPVIWIPDANDPDAYPKAVESARMLVDAGHTGPIGMVPLPIGLDPAKIPTVSLRTLVKSAI